MSFHCQRKFDNKHPVCLSCIEQGINECIDSRAPKKNKYKARKTCVDGFKFDSEKEAKYYCELKIRVKAGEVLRFHRQPIFDLPGGITYRPDFLVIYPNGGLEYIDCKGYRTKDFIRNKKQVKEIYGVDIIEA